VPAVNTLLVPVSFLLILAVISACGVVCAVTHVTMAVTLAWRAGAELVWFFVCGCAEELQQGVDSGSRVALWPRALVPLVSGHVYHGSLSSSLVLKSCSFLVCEWYYSRSRTVSS